MPKKTGVYQITNTKNGKSYIGSTSVNLEGRWTAHRSLLRRGKHYNARLQRAWDFYPPSRRNSIFVFDIVELTVADKTIVAARETFYIKLWNPEYNFAPVGESLLGYKHPKEFGEAISKRNKGKANPFKGMKRAPEIVAKIKEAKKDKVYVTSPETKAKQSAKKIGMIGPRKGIPWTEEEKKRLSQSHLGQEPWNKGVPVKPEAKAKMSKSKLGTTPWNKGVKGSIPWNKGISTGTTGVPMSDEHKAKIGAGNTGKVRSPELRHQWSENRKGKTSNRKGTKHTLETRQKISASKKDKPSGRKGTGRKPDCHPDREHWAKGLCRVCYMAERRNDPLVLEKTPKAFCHPDRPQKAKGLCSQCYQAEAKIRKKLLAEPKI